MKKNKSVFWLIILGICISVACMKEEFKTKKSDIIGQTEADKFYNLSQSSQAVSIIQDIDLKPIAE
jgi:uncharacterized protein (DUF2141 family)